MDPIPSLQPPTVFTCSTEATKKESHNSSATDLPEAPTFDRLATMKLLRRLDLRLLPWLSFIYLYAPFVLVKTSCADFIYRLCFLDRTNVGNARLVKLEMDLHMKGLDYNVALAVLFPFYVAAEIPSNMMMKRFRPSIWLSIIMVAWGIVMTCMGLVHNYSGLIACRIFLGIAEGGLFPGVNYYITMWYRRHECGFRMALFFSAATAAGAFGGLFARGISAMSGVGGKGGWSWIFILEGLLTLCVGNVSYWVIQDYPATAIFLTPIERAEVQRRLAADSSSLSDAFHLRFFYQALRDWKIWVMMLITIGIFTPLYSISLFLPTIIKQLGYSNNTAQLMTVPPYVVACFCTITGSYAADRVGQRGIFLLGFEVVALAGFAMLVSSGMPHVQYAGTFLAASGIFPLVPLICAWNSNNIGGSLKRGVGIAMQVGFGNLGGTIAAFVYRSVDQPRFIKGHSILIGLTSMSLCLTVFMTVYLRRENARRDAYANQHHISLEDCSEDIAFEEREKGDDAVFFRYTV